MVGLIVGVVVLLTRPIWHDEKGPVEADLGNITLSIPRQNEFTEVFLSDRASTGRTRPPESVSFRICKQRFEQKAETGCEIHGRTGTWVLLERPDVASEFNILKERPIGVDRPAEVDLVPQRWSASRYDDIDPPFAVEQRVLSRVRSTLYGDNPQLSTTVHSWPIADCDVHSAVGVLCHFGFLIEGTPVEAHWASSPDQNTVTQAQVWDIASDIDRRVRRLLIDPRQAKQQQAKR